MKVPSAIVALLFSGTVSAFAPAGFQQHRQLSLFMSEEPMAEPVIEEPKTLARVPAPKASEGGALVAIKEETVEFTAGLLGGAAGFVIGGPVLGAIGAASANYASKMDSDFSDVIQALSKSSIQVFNYLANLDAKYEVLGNAKGFLDEALDKLKSNPNVDPDTLKKVESALENTKGKIAEINDEYDLVGGGMTALGVVGDLVEKTVSKANKLNSEFALSDKAMSSLKTAVSKAKDAASKATSEK
mmetsp:Transcript_14764/g.32173  ORF Transcript_14764/g.32173 Transcript_14764/m.32173 type:complete len:244 (+) Transcript_14764:49-780(+)|eukprot:CAMPEP_0168741372 /NCGR_PEP_ID=MMETSP0724-20121128/12479_1 /TAXON_ID=265536 /ORGANISM="Amphiprora sp., Strain CCMP467" /LENGTH=243 /DNA_ID=CAMNT_0008788873 /DNA_START=50 /DNA_END=781 /DNA_ORIENTATION=-